METGDMKIDNKTLLTIVNNSVRETFVNMLGFDPHSITNPTINTWNNIDEPRNISGTVAFLQREFEGTLSIGFSKDSALNIFRNFYQDEFNSIDDVRITEGVAELANVIHGLVKERLNLGGSDYQMCLPVVVIGRNHAVFTNPTWSAISIKFETNLGAFFVEVISRQKKTAA